MAGYGGKNWFFDRAEILGRMEKAAVRSMSKFGAFVRTRARSSIRRRKKVSEPGQPPSAHAGQIKLIYFAYDPGSRSVVVGPVEFKRGEAPPLLEFGGEREKRLQSGAVKVQHYRPRPFMGPALEAEAPKFADQFKGSL